HPRTSRSDRTRVVGGGGTGRPPRRSRDRSRRCDGLVAIAEWAAQPEIRLVVRAAAGTGNDMYDLKSGHDQALRAETISATVTGRLADAADEIDGEILTRHRRPAAV